MTTTAAVVYDNSPVAERIVRPRVDALEEMLGQPIPVLDQGFIRVIDYMGDDAAIVQAARVSYGKGTKAVSEDAALIRFLLRHDHTTPFEMAEIKLHVRIPMDAWRQMIRQRTASVNEYSTRYSEAIDARQQTAPGMWRGQSRNNKQGSDGSIDYLTGVALTEREKDLHTLAMEVYSERLVSGVAREQARKDLPLSTYTEAYWKIDLLNLLKFLHKRTAPDAQLEVRSYANAIASVVARWVPLTWAAFNDYKANAHTLSARDIAVLSHIIRGDRDGALALAGVYGWRERRNDGSLKLSGEREELTGKLRALGIDFEWD